MDANDGTERMVPLVTSNSTITIPPRKTVIRIDNDDDEELDEVDDLQLQFEVKLSLINQQQHTDDNNSQNVLFRCIELYIWGNKAPVMVLELLQ